MVDAAWDDWRRLVVVGGSAEAWMETGARTVGLGTREAGRQKGNGGEGSAEGERWSRKEREDGEEGAGRRRRPKATRTGRRKSDDLSAEAKINGCGLAPDFWSAIFLNSLWSETCVG